MVLNQKALRTRIKEAYKNQSYTVAVDNGVMWICGGYWLVWVNTDEVSNEILSLITLHTRKTPQEGEAYKVVKGDNGPIVQKVLLDVAMAFAKTMGEHLAERTPHDEIRMLKTNLRYDGCGVWQNNSLLNVVLIDPRYEALIEDKKGITALGAGIYAEGEISGAWIMRRDMKGQEDQLRHLAGMRWVHT
jgi:hypothetical protein